MVQQQHHPHHHHQVPMLPPPQSQFSSGPGSSTQPSFRRGGGGGGGISQRGRSRGRLTTPLTNHNSSSSNSGSGMVAGFMDRVMSPFVQCWQPPLNSCLNSSTTTTPMVTPMANRQRGVMSPHHPAAQQQQQQVVMMSPPLGCPPQHQQSPLETTPRRAAMEEGIEHPSQVDVLLGRGGNSNRHNVHFRQLVAANKPYYTNLTKKQKMLVSRNIVDLVHQAGGHFLSKDPVSGLWKNVGLPRSLEKASQALREKSSEDSDFAANMDDDDTTNTIPLQQQAQQEQSHSETPPKLDPRTVSAPPLVVPQHLKDIYRPKKAPVVSQEKKAPSLLNGDNTGGWIAEFPPGSFVEPSRTMMEQQGTYHSTPYHHQTTTRFHPANDDDGCNLPAPHRGAFPFHARHMPRRSVDHIRRASPEATPGASTTTSSSGSTWRKTSSLFGPPTSPIVSSRSSWVHFPQHTTSTATTCSPDRGSSVSVPSVATTSAMTSSTTTTTTVTHSPPHSSSQLRFVASSDCKRQRTQVEDVDDVVETNNTATEDDNDKPFSLQDTSLPEGSEYLPPSEMGKLSLTDRVVGAPVAATEQPQPPGRNNHHHDDDNDLQSPSTVCLPRSRRSFVGVSHQPTVSSSSRGGPYEKDGMAGLAALSTAAFLRLDESGGS